jgi:choline dehydrogenase-like flavoprotein
MRFGATVWTGCRAERVLFQGKRAVGVLVEVDGRRLTVRARHVVVAAGGVQTPALLQRSRISDPSAQIGRNLTLHPGAGVAAVFEERVDGWTGAHQSYQVREFEEEGIILAAVNFPPSLVTRMIGLNGTELTEEMALYPGMVTAGVLVEDTGTGRVRAAGSRNVAVTYPVTPRDAARITRALTLLCEALFSAGARRIHLPTSGPAVTSPTDLHRTLAGPIHPGRIDLTTVHLMGTARLGADPTLSVCDPHGAVHGTIGLSVADASLFPGAVGVNPQLTVMALATRVAGRIIDEW